MFRSAFNKTLLRASRAWSPGSTTRLMPMSRLRGPLVKPPILARPITTVQPVRKKRRWPLILFGLTVLGGYGYWKWLTFHRYPPSVAKLLREGLRERVIAVKNGKPNYHKMLMKFIEALQEADRLRMLPWSDEYTGIQILIADIYVELHLFREAASMYSEVANTYLVSLRNGSIRPEDRDKIITRDLRVVLLASLVMSEEASSFRSVVELIGPHMMLATREAASKSEELQFLLHQQPLFDVGYLRDIRDKKLPNNMFEKEWGSYRDELFAMREVMTGMAAASGEYMQALMIKLKTTQIMLTSGFTTGECLLSAVNIASLMYLQAVNMKFANPRVEIIAEVGNDDAKTSEGDILPSNDGALSVDRESLDKMPLKKAVSETVTKNRPGKAKTQPEAADFLKLANNIYSEVIETILELDQRRTDLIPEAYVMALYGQGVIASSEGNWDLASDRLSEARLRAKGSEIEPLIETAESEIEKVNQLKDMTPTERNNLTVDQQPTIDVMFWKLAPSRDDLARPELPDPRL